MEGQVSYMASSARVQFIGSKTSKNWAISRTWMGNWKKKHEEHLADWWFQPAPLKNMKVNGKDYHSQYMDKIETVPNHQPVGSHSASIGGFSWDFRKNICLDPAGGLSPGLGRPGSLHGRSPCQPVEHPALDWRSTQWKALKKTPPSFVAKQKKTSIDPEKPSYIPSGYD